MNNIPQRLRKEMAADPYYEKCARFGDDCEGRITWEHSLIYAGRQIQEKWAIIPLCVWHHLDKGMIKWINEYIALSRASDEELHKYSKAIDLLKKRDYLKIKYNEYKKS